MWTLISLEIPGYTTYDDALCKKKKEYMVTIETTKTIDLHSSVVGLAGSWQVQGRDERSPIAFCFATIDQKINDRDHSSLYLQEDISLFVSALIEVFSKFIEVEQNSCMT
jgi:hypothetical protein